MIYVSRNEWLARPPRKQTTSLSQAAQRGLAVHHSGSQSERKQDHADCARVVQSIQRYHQDHQGWNDVAYSWLSCWHGYLYEGRGPGVRTASQGTNSGNDAWHSVCYLGDGSRFDGLAGSVDPLFDALRRQRSFAPAARQVWPHLRFRSTSCPGGALREWCRQFPD